MKKIGLAAVVMTFAVSAMASNFRAADQVYVPAAGKVGSFASDIYVSNPNAFPVTVSVIYSTGPAGTQTNYPNLFTLAANERREFLDFMGTAQPNGLGLAGALGQLVFNGCKQGTDCGVATQDPITGISPNFADITVQSRIYSTGSNGGTTGQLFYGVPWYSFASQDQQNNGLDTVFIVGFRQSAASSGVGTFRSNVVLANASQFSTTTVVARAFSGTGTKCGSDFRVTLGPLGQTQPSFGQMFPGCNGTFWLTVNQENSTATGDAPSSCGTSGCAGFFAFGSVLDNVTNDATTLEPQYTKSLTSAQIACIYPAPDQTVTCKSSAKMRRAVRH